MTWDEVSTLAWPDTVLIQILFVLDLTTRKTYPLQLIAKHPSEPSKYLESYLFNAAYYYTLLTHGYGLDATKTPVYDPDEINGHAVDALMGAQLSKACGKVTQPTTSTTESKSYTLYVVLALFLGFGASFIVYYYKCGQDEGLDLSALPDTDIEENPYRIMDTQQSE